MRPPAKLDVFFVQRSFRRSSDPRPSIVVNVSANKIVVVCLISSQMDLFQSSKHFLIESTDADFKSTGLVKSSYAAGDEIHELKPGELLERIGVLRGDLALRFEKWFG